MTRERESCYIDVLIHWYKEFSMKEMRRILFTGPLIIIILVFFLFLYLKKKEDNSQKYYKIGLIVPFEHQAMNREVLGFQDAMKENFLSHEYKVTLKNAQGDNQILKSIVDSYIQSDFDVIAPIGTQACLLTMNLVKDKTILCLDVSQSLIPNQDNVTGVYEMDPRREVKILKDLMPKLSELVIFHSADDKVFRQVKDVTQEALKFGITINPVFINALTDLYILKGQIPKNSQAIFILKDHLIASGISSLVNIADEHEIPLITSDNGSVEDGALLGIGNKEEDIGREGANILKDMFYAGKTPRNIKMRTVSKITLFLNKKKLDNFQDIANNIKAVLIKNPMISKQDF